MSRTKLAASGSRAGSRAGSHAAIALLYTALSLTLLEFFFLPTRVESRLGGYPPGTMLAPSMEAGLTWALATFIANLVLPAVIVIALHRQSLTSIGYRAEGFGKHIWVYLGLYVAMVPVILFVGQRADFQATYPFVKEATRSLQAFATWEVGYVAQFFALEAFFRGYLLFTLERKMGTTAVFVMCVPYGMIHYHKPFPEALGAIAAGVILGFLALRYRSWLGGAVLHSLVAMTMDGLAAHRAGLFS